MVMARLDCFDVSSYQISHVCSFVMTLLWSKFEAKPTAPEKCKSIGPVNLVNMSGCGFFEVGMDGLVETGLGKWKLNSANSAFFFRLYGEPFGASVFSCLLLKMNRNHLQNKTGPMEKRPDQFQKKLNPCQDGKVSKERKALTRSLRKELGIQPHGPLQPYSMTQLPKEIAQRLNSRERDSLDIQHAALAVTWFLGWAGRCRNGKMVSVSSDLGLWLYSLVKSIDYSLYD